MRMLAICVTTLLPLLLLALLGVFTCAAASSNAAHIMSATAAIDIATTNNNDMLTPATHDDTSLLTLRVDVQNAAASRVQAPLTLKVHTPTTLTQLHALLQGALVNAANSHNTAPIVDTTGDEPLAVEIYDPHSAAFVPLTSLTQLVHHRRARLNVRLPTTIPSTCLALPAKQFDASIVTIAGIALAVHEVGNAGKGTGLTTWDGAVVLAKYLEHARIASVRNQRVLELGAGTGLVGLAAALLGARDVVLTDLAYTLANLQQNVDATLQSAARTGHPCNSSVTVRELDWFDSDNADALGAFDLVLASDVVWVEALIAPLVATIDAVLHSSKTTLLLAHQTRSAASDTLLFTELAQRKLGTRQVPRSELHPDYVSEKIAVWEITQQR